MKKADPRTYSGLLIVGVADKSKPGIAASGRSLNPLQNKASRRDKAVRAKEGL